MSNKRLDRGQAVDTVWFTQASIDLGAALPCWKPAKGFQWLEGTREVDGKLLKSIFLCPVLTDDPGKQFAPPENLYEDFAYLTPNKQAILDFANEYGSLTLWGTQEWFQLCAGGTTFAGEEIGRWTSEIEKFNAAYELWFNACDENMGNVTRLSKFIGTSWKTEERRPLLWPGVSPKDLNALEFAKRAVIATINAAISPADTHDEIRPWLRFSPNQEPAVILVPLNLKKALWLQFAAAVSRQRRVKRCQAPDCPKPYMDVTNSPRPGARRMHQHCEERIAKRKYRENLRKRNRDAKKP